MTANIEEDKESTKDDTQILLTNSMSVLQEKKIHDRILNLWEKNRCLVSENLRGFIPLQPSEEFVLKNYEGARQELGADVTADMKISKHVTEEEIHHRIQVMWELERSIVPAEVQHLIPLCATSEYVAEKYSLAEKELHDTAKTDLDANVTKNVTDEDIYSRIQVMWESERAVVPLHVQHLLPLRASSNYVAEKYAVVKQQLYDNRSVDPEIPISLNATNQSGATVRESDLSRGFAKKINDTNDSTRKRSLCSTLSGIDMMLSEESYLSEDLVYQEEVTFASSIDILGKHASGTRCKFEGFLTTQQQSSLEPRTFKVDVSSKKKSKSNGKSSDAVETEDKSTLEFILLDRLGPVRVLLRDQLVESFMTQLTEQPKNVNLIVSMNPCRVAEVQKNDWNGKLLTSMGMLQGETSNPSRCGTIISFPGCASSQFLTDASFAAPEPPLCICNFAAVASKLVSPYRATFRGMVANMMSLDYNQNGIPKKKFSLVDPNGAWLPCLALYHNATNKVLVDGNEVILYFGTGRGVLGANAPSVYCMRDACILLVSRHTVLWPLRTEIELQ